MHAGKLAKAVWAGGGPSRGQRRREEQCLEHSHGGMCSCVKKVEESASIPLLPSEPIV